VTCVCIRRIGVGARSDPETASVRRSVLSGPTRDLPVRAARPPPPTQCCFTPQGTITIIANFHRPTPRDSTVEYCRVGRCELAITITIAAPFVRRLSPQASFAVHSSTILLPASLQTHRLINIVRYLQSINALRARVIDLEIK